MKEFIKLIKEYPLSSAYLAGATLTSIGIGGTSDSFWGFMIAMGVSLGLWAIAMAAARDL